MKILGYLIAIPLLICLIFSSNIYGYFHFKNYCETEQGLHIYEKLEKSAGWIAEDAYEAKVASQIRYVDFVRFIDKKDGKAYDVRYKGGNPTRDSAFEVMSADEAKPIIYRWKNVSETIDNVDRLMRSGKEVFNIKTNKLLVSSYSFTYSSFKNTPFDMPSNETCSYEYAERGSYVSGEIKALNTAFKN